MALFVSACVSSGGDEVLQSAIQPDTNTTAGIVNQPQQIIPTKTALIENKNTETGETAKIAFASEKPALDKVHKVLPTPKPVQLPRVKRTYLINGLASSVESIGYGFTNLSKKIPGAKLHNYASFIESSTVIRSKVTREIKAAYKKNPNVEINLIGISFGANIVTWIAQDLNRQKIPINYLATLEGPAMARIYDNVRLADNFSCSGLNCFRTTSKLAWRNKTTEFSKFKIKTGHVALANHPKVHARVIEQINKPNQSVEPVETKQIVEQ